LIVGPAAALVACAGFASSTIQINASRQAGWAAWETLLTLLAAAAFWRAQEAPARSSRWFIFLTFGGLCAWEVFASVSLVAGFALAAATVTIGGTYQRPRWPALSALVVVVAIAAVRAWLHGLLPMLTIAHLPLDWRQLLSVGGVVVGPGAYWLAPLVILGAISARARERGGFAVWWFGLSVAAWICAQLAWRVGSPYAYASEAPFWLLAGAGTATLLATVEARGGRAAASWFGGAMLVVVVLSQGWWVAAGLRPDDPGWREIAQVVRRNWRPDEAIVVLQDRAAFVFYAPDLERRVEPQLPPVRAVALFTGAAHGWLVVPRAVHFYPGWPVVEARLRHIAKIDLSPQPALGNLYYLGGKGKDELLLRVAFFDLPGPVLMQGSLLFDALQQIGALPQLLWKVDQLALAAPQPGLRNPSLLNVVLLLAEKQQGDRAASLAYRLATAVPDWPEARPVLAAFLPAHASTP
jgi:hypothetical protein